MTGLVIIIVVAAIVFGRGDGDPGRITTFAEGITPMSGAFAATITAFFSFLGFEAAANMAEEVKNPSRAYPRALFGAILTAGVVYMLIALGAALVVPTDQLAQSEGPLLEVITASGLSFPPWLFAAIALVAIGNGALLFMVMASRATYGLAEAGLLPKMFGQVAPTRRTPWVAILVIGAMTMVMSFVGDVGTLADTTVLLLVLVFISANISVLVLKKDTVDHDHFTAPRIVSILALVASIALLTQQSLQTWLISLAYIVVGVGPVPHRPGRPQARGHRGRGRRGAEEQLTSPRPAPFPPDPGTRTFAPLPMWGEPSPCGIRRERCAGASGSGTGGRARQTRERRARTRSMTRAVAAGSDDGSEESVKRWASPG